MKYRLVLSFLLIAGCKAVGSGGGARVMDEGGMVVTHEEGDQASDIEPIVPAGPIEPVTALTVSQTKALYAFSLRSLPLGQAGEVLQYHADLNSSSLIIES